MGKSFARENYNEFVCSIFSLQCIIEIYITKWKALSDGETSENFQLFIALPLSLFNYMGNYRL